MKILHINTSDIIGGAAKAAYRLHSGLNKAGYDSYMLVANKQSDEKKIIKIQMTKWQSLINKAYMIIYPRYFAYRYKPTVLFSTSKLIRSNIVSTVRQINPDIIHLHWISHQFINLRDLPKLEVPIIWTLHDEWAITGGCHYDDSCQNFENNCGYCPALESKIKQDLSCKQFNLKSSVYSKISHMVFNGVSQWITKKAAMSKLTNKHKSVNLPNLLDIKCYAPVDKIVARQILNLSRHTKVILFGAMSATVDKRKGFDLLIKALQLLPKHKYQLVIFGSSNIDKTLSDLNIMAIGTLHDDYSLKLLYSAANVMVVPSRQENLSNTIMESLSCGTPVVAFDIGGNSDMIDHKSNGYLAKAFDCADLALGIEWVIDNPEDEQLACNARKKIVDNFSEQVVIPKYIELYKNLL